MVKVDAKCTNCGEKISIDGGKEANVCPCCSQAFITEKAIRLFNENSVTKKKRHVWKSLGRGILMTFYCLGYLIYVLTLMWLIFDIVDNKK